MGPAWDLACDWCHPCNEVAAAQADVAIAAIGLGNATRHHRHQRAD